MFTENRKPDFLTGLVIPVVGAIVAVVSLQRDHPYIAALALCVIALGVMSRYGSVAVHCVRRVIGTRRDRRLLRQAMPELRDFVTEFGRFLILDERGANPYSILQRGTQPNRTAQPFDFNELALANPDTLSRFRSLLHERCRSDDARDSEIRQNFAEFHAILEAFDQGSLLTIFKNRADRLRNVLRDDVRSELNAAREQYVDFLRRYVTFLKELNGKLSDKIMPFVGGPPKPL